MPLATYGKTIVGFRSTQNKGIDFTFPNGWTVSIRFGAGDCCENSDMLSSEGIDRPDIQCSNAEVWCWDDSGRNYPEQPIGYQNIGDVLRILNRVSKEDFNGQQEKHE